VTDDGDRPDRPSNPVEKINMSTDGQMFYQAKLDNGETRWAKTNQLRRARL
jgi:hypothetical protein